MNKTVLLVATVLILVLSVGVKAHATVATDYSAFINNFTTAKDGTVSGLSGGTAKSSTSNNDVIGLVFNISLGIDTTQIANDTIEKHWENVTNDTGSAFLIELCNNANQNQCWLSPITYSSGANSNTNNGIYAKTLDNDYVDSENVSVSTFDTLPGDTANPNAGATTIGGGIADTTTGGNVDTYNPSTNVVSSVGNLVLTKGVPLTASLWYCANSDGAGAAAAYKANGTPMAGIRTFGDLCSGGSYFQIGQPLSVTIPATAAAVQQQVSSSATALATAATANSSDKDNLPECGVVPGIQHGTINGCAADLAYLIYQGTAWVAGLFGDLFDFFIGYSVSSASYSYPFVVTGWKLVRDISNIFFIIIMVWTGFSAVFDTEKTSMKKVVPALIINAILINFSLFFTHVVIDISNVTARIFYSEMLVCKQSDIVNGACPPAKALTGTGGYWPLSVKIVSSFNPQTMFKPSVLNPSTATTDVYTGAAASAANTSQTNQARQTADYFAIVSLVAAGIMILIAIMFFKVSFLFLGRVVGLYICMIFSPFAFLSRGIPAFNKIERFKWDDWMKELTSYAMMAPIFIFFLYIIYTFLSSNFVQQIGVQALAASGFFATVMSIAIPMLIIYFLLQAAQKAAEGLSGEIGKAIQKFGEQATGLAIGAATGGASLLGSNTIGRGANKLANNERFRDWASRNGRIGRVALKSVDSVGKSTFDARNTTVGKGFSKQFGVNLDQKGLGTLGLDTKSTKGGYRQKQDDKVKRDEEYKKLLVTKKSDDEIKASYSEDELTQRYKYDDNMDAELRTKLGANLTDDQWKNFKEGKGKGNKDNKEKYEKSKKAYLKTTPPPAIYLTAADRNEARTEAYATYKEQQSGGAFATQDYYRKDKTIFARKGELLRNPYAPEPLFNNPQDAENNVNAIPKGKEIAKKNLEQLGKEMLEGMAKYGSAGAIVGSAVPVLGTATVGAAGTLFGALKAIFDYSGTTNKRSGGALRTVPKKRDKLMEDLAKEFGGDDEAGGATPPPPPPPAAGGAPGGPTNP